MAKQIGDLRDALFDTLDQLRDKENPMDLDRAKAVAEVAQVIINTAKVEVDFMRQRGNDRGTGFVPDEPDALPASGAPRLIKGRAQSGSR